MNYTEDEKRAEVMKAILGIRAYLDDLGESVPRAVIFIAIPMDSDYARTIASGEANLLFEAILAGFSTAVKTALEAE